MTRPIRSGRPSALEDMNEEQWESLCDGCGRCCLNKLEDWDTGEIAWTNVACRLLDPDSCRCKDYENRTEEVADCIGLTPQSVRTLSWLPPSCGYRLIAEGRDLYWWHPLLSGDPTRCIKPVYPSGAEPLPRRAWSRKTTRTISLNGHLNRLRTDAVGVS